MQFQRLTSELEVRDLILWHNEHSDYVVFDVETTSKEARKAVLLDIQLSGTNDEHVVIFKADYRKLLIELSPKVVLVAHNAKYDLHVLYRHGVDLLDRPFRDTLLLGHLIDENRESYSLDSYVKEFWNDPYKEEFWAKHKTYGDAKEEEQAQYACKDILYTGLLYRRMRDTLSAQSIPPTLIEDIHRLQTSLLRTEIEGLTVDVGYLEELGVKLKRRIDELEPKMRESVKDEIELVELGLWSKEIGKYKTDQRKAKVPRPEFSFESSRQLQDLLYTHIGLPRQYNEKTKAISTDYSSLQRIKEDHPVIELILENRDLQKVYTSYVEGTIDRMYHGRIYPEFRVNGTKGSRISHSNPNLAQMPSSGGVKGIYLPDEGELLNEFDYSQLEVCIEAHLTGDKNLLEIVCGGASKHDITAKGLKIERSVAKTVNFAMQYWCGPDKVAKILGVSKEEGKYAWNKFWETYSGPKKLKDKTDRLINAGQPIVDMFGRQRRFPVGPRNPWSKDYRSGYNFIVQSPGGQLMNNSFYKANEYLRKLKIGKGILTVHDSGLMGIKKDYLEDGAKAVEEFMVNEGRLAELSVPLKVSSQVGMSRWLDKI